MKVDSYHSSQDGDDADDLGKRFGFVFDSCISKKKIDMNTIEELKMRRNMSREKGESLASKRDETIKKIQKDMSIDIVSKYSSILRRE